MPEGKGLQSMRLTGDDVWIIDVDTDGWTGPPIQNRSAGIGKIGGSLKDHIRNKVIRKRT